MSPTDDYLGENGTPFNVGSFVPFEFQITDFDSNIQSIEVQLNSNIDGNLYEGVPDANGILAIQLASLSAGEHQLSLSLRDNTNFVSKNFTIRLNNPPPSPVISILPEQPTTSDDLYVDIQIAEDADGDDTSYTIEWLNGGIVVPDETDLYLSSDYTSKGERWYVRVTPFDQYGSGQTAETNVVIGNSSPLIQTIDVLPENPFNDQILTCHVEVLDPDDDELHLSYQWRVFTNGLTIDLDENTSEILPRPDEISPGDRVFCHVEASDSISTTSADTQVLIENRPPELSEVWIVSDADFTSGSTLECIGVAQDVDGDTFDVTYQWRSGNNDPNGHLLSIQNTLTLSESNAHKGEYISCFATVTDSFGDSHTDLSSIAVQNSPPEMNFAVLSPTNPTASNDIFCYATANDIDVNDTVTLNYEWFVDGIPLNYSSDTLPGSNGYFGYQDTVSCTVTPNDGSISGIPVTSSVQIMNSEPEIHSITLQPSEIFTNTIATAMVDAEDTDGQPILFTYNWYIDGMLVQSDIYNTLDGSQYFDKDQSISVEVIASDGIISTSSTSSPEIVLNSPPSTPEIYLNEFTLVDTPLQCELTTPSIDPDGDVVDYSFAWQDSTGPLNSGLLNTEWTNDTISNSIVEVNDAFSCTVTATDGELTTTNTIDTLITACEIKYTYDIEEDLSDIYAPDDCWEIARAQSLPPETLLPFLNQSVNSGIELNCFQSACIAYNPTESILNYYYGNFPPHSISIHTDSNPTHPVLKWQAPTNGTCVMDLTLMGLVYYATARTNAEINIYHEDVDGNFTLLDTQSVTDYLLPQEIDITIPVSGGDHLYLTSSGGWIYNWVNVSGDISCQYEP